MRRAIASLPAAKQQTNRQRTRMLRRLRWLLPVCLTCLALLAHADGAGDNSPDNVRRIPPPGVTVSDADRQELSAGIEAFGKSIEELKTSLRGRPKLRELLPDVQIYYNAARYGLTYNEF